MVALSRRAQVYTLPWAHFLCGFAISSNYYLTKKQRILMKGDHFFTLGLLCTEVPLFVLRQLEEDPMEGPIKRL